MNVSQFELIFKPQSPEGPADTVLQGYFLKISNLEDQALSFRLDFTTSPITDPDRSLFDNTVVFVDTPGEDNAPGTFTLVADVDAKSFRLNPLVTVPAHGTALVAVLPSDPFAMPGCTPPTPDFECRGYVDISLPALFQFVPGPGGFGVFQQVAQSDTPVDVLLTPQNRATYFKPEGSIGAQTQSSLPLANGAGKMSIEPGQPFGLGGAALQASELDDLVADLPESAVRPALLATLMGQIDGDKMDLVAFNATLQAAGINLALEPRKSQAQKKSKAPRPETV
ncbi:hypothetical protein So717_29070 [Roseobacter cerasinus]|uniref:Uncharacterized protein n=1 Tax=Roseobacter cerasinus TaxID=2602289 RepID=A0A640VU81_9RHOB|nr:hypothetical protein [Roseobacter cerasinus]GFE51154.1 hypothetical protein So717_29070 [Roseobacter cerasinus]